MEIVLIIIFLSLTIMFFIAKKIYAKFHIVYFMLAVGFLACIYKIVETQYINGDVWASVSKMLKKTPSNTLMPKRGTIYCLDNEKHNVILTSDFPAYEIAFDGAQLVNIIQSKITVKGGFSANDSIKKLSIKLSNYFNDKTAKEYEAIISNAFKTRTKAKLQKRDINYIELLDIAQFPLLKGKEYHTCLEKQTKSSRIMPYSDLAVRTIGRIDKDTAGGLYGIERKFNELLKGGKGSATSRKINRRKSATDILEEAQNGADITLTLDMDLQEIVTNCLIEGASKTNAERACAIVMETTTGEIKAIANIGRSTSGGYTEFAINHNMAISDYNELGSVFKIPSIIVALESGLVADSTLVDVENSRYSAKDHKQLLGMRTVAEVIAMSSNVGTANIVCPFFEKKQTEFVNLIKKTHFDTPIVDTFLSHKKPSLYEVYDRHNRRDTSLRTFSTFTYGYQAKIPPIYMLRFYNAIANNGKMIDPFIVKKIEDKHGIIFSADDYKKERIITNAICSASVLKSIQKMLRQVVESSIGTAYYRNVPTSEPKIKLAGKTGTADLNNGSKGTFCGYFPADQPQYSCIVVMERSGKRNLWGTESYIVFKNIAEKIFSVKNSTEFSQLPDSIKHAPKNINTADKKIAYLAKYMKIK